MRGEAGANVAQLLGEPRLALSLFAFNNLPGNFFSSKLFSRLKVADFLGLKLSLACVIFQPYSSDDHVEGHLGCQISTFAFIPFPPEFGGP